LPCLEAPVKMGFISCLPFLEGWFVLDHLFSDVMDGHRIDGDRFAGIEQFTDGLATLGFEGDLA